MVLIKGDSTLVYIVFIVKNTSRGGKIDLKHLFPRLLEPSMQHLNDLKGYCTPYQKLTYFELYFKIVNTFMKNNILYVSNSKLTKNSKMTLKFR